jgi:hypothetical protein
VQINRRVLSAAHSLDERKLLIRNGLGVLVDQTGASWNRVTSWFRDLELLRRAA